MRKVVADNKLPDKSVNRLTLWTVYPKIENNSSVQDICLYRCLTAYRVGYLITFLSDMTHTGVSSSPPLEILPLEYMAVLESNRNQLVNVLFVKSGKKTCICHSHKYKFSPNV